MFSFIFLLSDFVLYELMHEFVFRLLLIRFIDLNLHAALMTNVQLFHRLLVPFALLLLEDVFLYGRFGLGLAYLLIAFFLCRWLRVIFDPSLWVLPYVVVVVSVLMESLVVKKLVLQGNTDPRSTFFVISLNLLATFFYKVFMGTRGNRTLVS